MCAMLQVRKALPKLQIFNARPVDKHTKNEGNDKVDGDILVDSESQKDRNSTKEKDSKHHPVTQNEDYYLETMGRKSSKKRKKTADVSMKDVTAVDKKTAGTIEAVDHDMENKSIKKKQRNNGMPQDEGLAFQENVTKVDKKQKRSKNREQSEIDVIDDADASFVDLFNVNDAEALEHGGVIKVYDKVPTDVNLVGNTVPSLEKRKSTKKRNMEPPSYPSNEIGLGGPSTWGDEW